MDKLHHIDQQTSLVDAKKWKWTVSKKTALFKDLSFMNFMIIIVLNITGISVIQS